MTHFSPNQQQALLFVDPRVQDYSALLQGLNPRFKVFVLNLEERGVTQIGQVLAGVRAESGFAVGSVHVLCHGAPGCLYLGAGELSLSTLAGDAEAIATWFPAAATGHELLLYGCNVAAGDAGEEFIAKLQGLTGAAIAASTTPIGCTDKGGNWELDAVRGEVSAELAIASAAQASYRGILADPVIEGLIRTRLVNEDDSRIIRTLQITDADGDNQRVSLSVTEGILALATTTNLMIVSGADNSSSITIEGTLVDINNALDGIRYTPTPGFFGTDAIDIATFDGTNTISGMLNLSVAPVNDEPTISPSALTVLEGGVNDPTVNPFNFNLEDVDTLPVQIIIKIDTLPSRGVLKFDGNFVVPGSTFSSDQLNLLTYEHDGTQTTEPGGTADSFTVTVDDGAGGEIDATTINIEITPVNQSSQASASNTLFEGQTDVPVSIAISDPDQNLATPYQIEITSLPSDGTLSFNGVELTPADLAGPFVISSDDLANLTYSHDGNDGMPLGDRFDGLPADDSFNVEIIDDGGGTGIPGRTPFTVDLGITPNNDDPVLDTDQVDAGLTYNVDDIGRTVTLTSANLDVSDVDSTDTQITYTLAGAAPTLGTIQLNGQALGIGGSFSQDDIENGRVTYVFHSDSPGNTTLNDSFSFEVRDSEVRQFPTVRDGGVYPDDSSTTLSINTFNIAIETPTPLTSETPPTPESNDPPTVEEVDSDDDGTPDSRDSDTPGFVDNNMDGVDDRTDPDGDGVPDAIGVITLDESGSTTITNAILATADDTPATELVYTIRQSPSSGSITLNGAPLVAFQTFTQDDVNNNRVGFSHAGGEDFIDELVYTVSDGSNTTDPATLAIDVIPINDSPTIAVAETPSNPPTPLIPFLQEGGMVTIDDNFINLSDVDGSGEKSGVGFATPNTLDNLTFTVTSLPANGTLTLNGGAVMVGTVVTQRQLNNGELVYEHDGSENFSDSFDVEADDNTGEANQIGNTATINIDIASLNDAPFESANVSLVVEEEGTGTISGSGVGPTDPQLVYEDPDNTIVQRQYAITENVAFGTVLLNGQALGVGSVFTQEDLDNNRITYEHDGTENYADFFEFQVRDGGAAPVPGRYDITIEPRNDPPELEVPGTQLFDSDSPLEFNATNGNRIVVTDDDLINPDTGLLEIDAGEVDVIRVTLDLQEPNGDTYSGSTLTFGTTSGLSFENGTSNGSTDGTVTIEGTIADVQAALDSLQVQVPPEGAGLTDEDRTLNLEVTVDDRINGGNAAGTGGTIPGETVTDVIPIQASNDNDAPSLVNPSDVTADEDTRFFFTGANAISIDDVDAFDSETNTVTLTVANGTLQANNSGGAGRSGNNTNTLTLTGTVAEINSALATLSYLGDTDFNDESTDSLSTGARSLSDRLNITVNDGGNTGLNAGVSEPQETLGQVDIVVTPVNDRPTLVAPTDTLTVADSNPLEFSTASNAITIDDLIDLNNGGNDEFTVTLSITDAAGSLTPIAAAGATITDSGTNSVTIAGTRDAINMALDGLEYAPGDTDAEASYVLSVTVNDEANGGTGLAPNPGIGGALEATANININVSGANDLPTITAPDTSTDALEVNEDTPLSFTGANQLSIDDVDDFGAELEVTLTVTEGTIALGTAEAAALDFSVGDGTGDATVTFRGTEAEIDAALATVVYQGNLDYFGPDSLTITVDDLGNTGIPNPLGSQTTQVIDIDVLPINDEPSFTNLGGSIGITEGDGPTALDTNAVLADPELDQFNDWDGAILTLERQGGANSEDEFTLPDGATSLGTVTQNANGTLSFTFNNTATSDDVDELLQGIQYRNTSSTPPATLDIAYTINDGNTGGQGSGGDLDATGSVTVNINRLPEAFDDAFTAVEDVQLTGNVLTSDNGSGVDDPGDPTATVTSFDNMSAEGGTVSVAANGDFTYQPVADFVGIDTFTYTITDDDGDTSTATVTVNVQRDTDGDEIPDVTDLDDDNDGILDTTELGGLDPNQDSDMDGTPDWQDSDAPGFVDDNSDGIDDRFDPDGDGKPNHLDIDADNDGIPDNVEAQTTADYIAPSGVGADIMDVNQNGVDDVYEVAPGTSGFNADGIGLDPVNSDSGAATSDSTPDYLDEDSDNDGTPDIQENGLGDTATPGDTDGDGLLDVFETESATDGFDVNDSIDNPANSVLLPDSDNDVSATGDNASPLSIDLDFREDTPPVVDLDDDSAMGDADYSDTFVENGSAVGLTDGNATITDVDSTSFTELQVTVGSVVDGASEVLLISGSEILLDDSATPATVTVGTTTYDVDFSGNDITFTLNGGGNIPEADAEALLNAIQYENRSETPTTTASRTFDISTNDGNSDSNLARATIAIDAVPDAVDDAFTAVEDVELTGNVLTTDNGSGVDDPGDPTATVTAFDSNSAEGGTVSVAANGDFTYQPAADFVGTDAFTYTITDADGDTSTATVTVNVQRDTDGDEIPDVTDLDDDNDGILDTTELGGLDPNQDSDMDGTPDWQDSDAPEFVDDNSDGIDDRFDPDGDGKPNHLDIDADNDGIPDNVEAQTTADYIAPSGVGADIMDVNQNGVDDVYEVAPGTSGFNTDGIGLDPVNSDSGAATSDSTPDYLDEDSDNDGTPDIQENGLGDTATPGDTDGDGLLDVFEDGTPNDGFDVNDSIDVPSSSVLPDSDGDVSATGDNANPLSIDLDFREDTPPVVDLDDDSAMGDADYSDTFVENGSAVGLTDGNATITDVDSTSFTELQVTVGGVVDGASEVLLINGSEILLDDSATPATVTVGTTIYDVDFSGNDITFTLNGGGNIPEADAEALLNAIQYENRSETPTTTAARTFDISTNDGNSDSNLARATIAVDAVPDAVDDAFTGPEDTDITGNVFDDNGGGTDDLGDVPGTTVTIADPADQPSNGSVVINDDGSFTYTPDANFNGNDSFTYTVTDADGDTSTAVVNLTVNPINDAPTVTGLADPLTYSENADPVVLDGDALLADIDLDGFDNWDGSTLTIERQAAPVAEDVFGESGTLGALTEGAPLVVGGTTIGLVATNTDGTLELQFNDNATAALVDSVIQQITYQNTSDDPPASIALEYTISDGNDGNQGTNPAPDGTNTPLTATAIKTVNISRENDQPVLTPGDPLIYTENQPAQVVDATIALADPDDTEIVSGTVTLSDGFTPGDLLAVETTGTNISASYEPLTGELTLSGPDTLANYQAVLQAVTFANSSDDPTAISGTREVTWQVVDANSDGLGAATSDPVTSTITVIPLNDPPVLELDGDDSSGATGADYQTLFVPGNGGVAIADAADTAITDLDDTNIESATLTLTNLLNGNDESLSLTGAALTAANAAGITGVNYSPLTGVLTLTGSASLAAYEAAIAAITYDNVAAIPDRSDRIVTVVVQDAGGDTVTPENSNIATATIRFDSDNDGIADTVDLDDDNDGIPDEVELDGDPTRDTDGDGIIDSLDVDADNDGITDVIEAGGPDANADGRIDGFTDDDNDGLADSVDDVDSGSGAGEVSDGMPLATPNTDGSGRPNFQDIDADDDGIPDNIEAQPTDTYVPPADNDSDGDGLDDAYDPDAPDSTPITTPENTDGEDAPDYIDEDSDNDGLTDLQENGDPDGLANSDADGDGLDDNFDDVDGHDVNDEIVDPATDLPDTDGTEDVNYRDREDTDNDGVPDPQDIDDDNDGILDTVELGGLDPDQDSDGDGTADWQDPDSAGFIDNNGDDVDDRFDADGDGIANHLDIDADNDGIPDQVEAQSTDNYIPPSGVEGGISDGNNDGLDDNYGAGLTPVDTDETLDTADGIADYLDLDSDNDGLTDLQENGFGVTAPGTADTDGDGLLNEFEVDINDGFVVNGRISDPNPTTLPDTDRDVAADGNDASPLTRDLDYRDNTAEVTITANDPAASEPNGSDGNGQFTVTLSQPSAADTTVIYSIASDPAVDAINGSDYTTLTGTVVIPAGATSATIDVDVLDDNILEDDEQVTLTLETATNPNGTVNVGMQDTATVTIADDDAAVLAIAAVTDAAEPGTNGQFAVTLTQPSDTDTVVSYTVTGDATPGADYLALSDTVIIRAGETSVPINIEVINDILVEDNETVTVTLDSFTGDSNISIDADSRSDTVNISDDDAVLVSVVATDPLAAEPDNNGQFTIAIEQPSDTETVVEYTITGTATSGADYDATPFTGSIRIPANETSVTLDVTVLEDILSELDETVVITLDNIIGDADIRIDTTQNEDTVTILADADGDNIPDVDDLDDDNDGILDTVEENGVPGRDTDGDGIPDIRDLDSDNDGINDVVEAGHGADDDGNGILDGPFGDDGVPDVVQDDPDGGTVNYGEPLDTDEDGRPDFQDLDSDNDSLPDLYEGGSGGTDVDGDGVIDLGPDTDNDGIQDSVDDNPGYGDSNSPETPNSDTDDLPDYRDLDSDGDGSDDIDEASNGSLDTDNDGRIDDPSDNDLDGIPDVVDDSDLDGIPDVIDDSDMDGTPDADPSEDDQAYGGLPLIDTDGDGVIDVEDLDDDNDGILDTVEDLGDPDRDTDGDGIVDRLDLDSDNDGINDLVESQSGGPDLNGDGVVDGDVGMDGVPDELQDDPEGGTVNYGDPVDSDGDGQRDFQDLDSDNDSISDLSEGGSGGADANGDGVIDGPDTDGDGIQDSVDGDPNDFGDASNPPLPNEDNDPNPDYLDIDSDGDGLPDIIEAGNGILDRDGDGEIDDATDVDNDGIADVIDDNDDDGTPDPNDPADPNEPTFGGLLSPGPDADGDGIPNAEDLDDDNDGIPDTVEEATAPQDGPNAGDTDGDGIPDRLDLDADNDGIPDVIEAGHGQQDIDGDGMLDGPVGTDGIPDEVQDDPDSGTINYDPLNSDSDGQPNFQDLDSDNDGLSDLLEGGALDNGGIDEDDNGVLDGPDVDGDGIPDSVDGNPNGYGNEGSPTLPSELPNEDGDEDPDYIDLDSDNNGRNDVSPSLDLNGDGEIDDVTDNDNDGIADIIDDSDLDGTSDPDDPDAQSFGGLPATDTDGDGVPDSRDLDDDNDGILDTAEGDGNLDTDGDGIPDSLDLDADNDGILDVTEAGHGQPDLDGDGRVDGPAGDNGLPDAVETTPESDIPAVQPIDTDGDGAPDFQDLDSDNDGINDVTESGGSDPDGDGIVGAGTPVDVDEDGILDVVDPSEGGTPSPVLDTDNDTIPDYRDTDSDNDGTNDVVESGNASLDTDGDGAIDGPDSDGDGIVDPVDPASGFGDDGTGEITPDSNGDGIPDYRQPGLTSTPVGSGGADEINGTTGDDVLVGLSDDDQLIGGQGNDVILGGSDQDITNGGEDNDIVNGGSDGDQVIAGPGTDIANGGSGDDNIEGNEGNDIANGGSGADTIDGGSGDDILNGGSGSDVILGGAGSDLLRGSRGDDMLVGGDGADLLMGGQGNDVFAYNGVSEFGDTIMDFEIIRDRIDLSPIFNGNASLGSNVQAQQLGAHSVILADAGAGLQQVALLLNVNANTLDANNFIF